MSKDNLKTRVRFSTTLRPEVEKALKEHSKLTDVPISKIVDKALAQYLGMESK